MKYFLLVYNQREGELVSIQEFDEQNREQAQKERFRRELLNAGNRNTEIVLLSAESRQALERTHARYFKSVGELAADG